MDPLGRGVEVGLFSGASKPSTSATPTLGTTTTAYDAEYTTVTDPAGKKRRSLLDGLGRLVRVDEPTGSPGALGATGSPSQATSYSYNALDNLTRVTQGTQTRTFVYDSLSRLTSASNPESGTIAYSYDNNGNLTQRTDARSVVTAYSYDRLDRLTGRSYSYTGSETAVNLETTRVDYAYDRCGSYTRGRLCSVTAKKGATQVSRTAYNRYDALGRVLESTQTTEGQAYTMAYAYDRAGNLTRQRYPSDRVVDYVYDGAGRIAGAKTGIDGWYAGGTGDNAVEYEPHGGVKQLLLGNGLWEQRRYNARLQPTQIGLGTTKATGSLTATGPTPTAGLLLLDYSYGTASNNGNVLSQRIRAGTLNQTQSYTYDELNRLKTAREAGSGTGWSQTYGYDRYGNRRVTGGADHGSNPALTPQMEIDIDTGSNRLAGIKGMNRLGYDWAGNLTADWAGRSLTYDGDNRMVSFDTEGTDSDTTYSYDGEGRRVKKVVGGAITVYVYNAAGQLVAEYTNPWRQETGTRYLTTDHLGSTRVVTGEDQGVLSRHDYLPFGEEIGAALGNRNQASGVTGYTASRLDGPTQKFTGQERDGESQLDYFGARYFGGAGGRFTSVDPGNAGAAPTDPQSWNGYSYALNNPLRYTDPFGQWPSPAYDDLDEEQRRLLDASEVEINGDRLSGSKLWQALSEMGKHGEAIQNAFVSITNSLASAELTNGQTALSQVSGITSLEPDRIKLIAAGELYSSLSSDSRFEKALTLWGHKGYEYRGFKSKHKAGNLNFSFAPPEVKGGVPTGVDIDIDLKGDFLGHAREVFGNWFFSRKTDQDEVRKILMKRGIVLTPSPDPKWNP